MEIVLNKILSQIHHQEDKLSSQMMRTADEAYQMTLFLNEMLRNIKAKVLQDNFVDEQGQPLSMSTVQTYLSPNRTDKDPNSDVSVKF